MRRSLDLSLNSKLLEVLYGNLNCYLVLLAD
jgi:hypothetical protein